MYDRARFGIKFCRKRIQRAAEPSAARGGCSEAKQGQRSQSASALQCTPRDAGTAPRTKRERTGEASRSVVLFEGAPRPHQAAKMMISAVTKPKMEQILESEKALVGKIEPLIAKAVEDVEIVYCR